VRLTEGGEVLLVAVTGAFENIVHAIERVTRAGEQERLNVSSTPSFAIKWLVPRLNRFLALYPGVDVRIDMSRQVVDLDRGEADIAIRFGTGRYPGLSVERLLVDTIFPVCSPALTKGRGAIRKPADLRDHTLIHVDWQSQGDVWPTWEMWPPPARSRGSIRSAASISPRACLRSRPRSTAKASPWAIQASRPRISRPAGWCARSHSSSGAERLAYWIVMPLRSSAKRRLRLPRMASRRGVDTAAGDEGKESAAAEQDRGEHRPDAALQHSLHPLSA